MTTKHDLSHPAQQRLVQQHVPLVGKIARSMAHGLPSHVLTDDLVPCGSAQSRRASNWTNRPPTTPYRK